MNRFLLQILYIAVLGLFLVKRDGLPLTCLHLLIMMALVISLWQWTRIQKGIQLGTLHIPVCQIVFWIITAILIIQIRTILGRLAEVRH